MALVSKTYQPWGRYAGSWCNEKLDPVGWKIVLEVIVKTKARFLEIPIVFSERQHGTSKLNAKAQVEYLLHLLKLYRHTHETWAQFLAFCLVGGSGVLIDTIVLVFFVEILSLTPLASAVFAFFAAVSWNFYWNSDWTFHGVRCENLPFAYVSFIAVCLVRFLVRLAVMFVCILYGGMGIRPWYVIASILGIISATVFNFVGAKYVVFRKYNSSPEQP